MGRQYLGPEGHQEDATPSYRGPVDAEDTGDEKEPLPDRSYVRPGVDLRTSHPPGTSLVIWFRGGDTALFYSVEGLSIGEYGDTLEFSYYDVSTVRRWAHFDDVVGYALSTPLPERDTLKEK